MKPKRHIFKTVLLVMLMACLTLGALFALTGCKVYELTPEEAGYVGQDGKDGKDGVTPHIGTDGYWYFGDEKTEYKAVGTDGADGADGTDGKDGTNGKDGVTPHIGEDGYWYFGTEKTEYKAVGTDGADGTDGKDGADGKSAYELYLEQYKKEHSGQSEGAMSEDEWLESLQGEDAKLEGFFTGKGDPTFAELTVEDGNFYLDTETGDIYQASVQRSATAWNKVGTLDDKKSAGYLVSIHYGTLTNAKGWITRNCDDDSSLYEDGYYAQFWRNSLLELGGGWYLNASGNDSNLYGYWFYFADNTVYWLQTDHMHDYNGAETASIYDKDCEKGTVEFKKCTICNEWALFVTPADKVGPVQHKYDTEVWRFDETQHWHAITCTHKNLGNKDVNEHDFFTYATVKWDGQNAVKEPSYEYWKECSVCGYKEKVVTKESFEQADGIIHITSTSDWNVVSNLIAAAEDTSEWKIRLDADLDFKGAEIKPIGMPKNASELVKLDDIGYAFDTTKTVEGGFKGTFDGQNKTIKNFNINGTYFTGLFACLNGGTVKDLKIEGTVTLETEGRYKGRFVSSSTNIKGDAFVGAVAGFITGESARITNVTTTDVVLVGNRHVGGIAGYAYKAGPAISAGSVTAESQEAAIKGCLVKGTSAVRATWNLPLQVYTDHADGKQDDYWNGTNLGGILGTAVSSSVISCEVENLYVQGVANINFIVGYAEGVDASNRAAVVSNKGYNTSYGSFRRLEGAESDINPELYAQIKAFDLASTTTGNLLKKGNYVIDAQNEQANARPAAAAARFKKAAPAAVGEELDIYTFEELQNFATRVNGTKDTPAESFANATITIMEDIDMSGTFWTPINAFNRQLAGATIQGFSAEYPTTLTGMYFTEKGGTADYTYGLGFISSVAGSLTVQDLIFEQAKVTVSEEKVTGNVIGVVCGYVYSTTTFRNVTVQECEVYGYGKVGGIVGMGADPGVAITFDGCKSLNNQFFGVYNVGGFAGNIQRGYDGIDHTVFKGVNESSGNTFSLLDNSTELDVEAKFSMTDRDTGTLYTQKVTGTYVLLSGSYYFGGSAKYYISYGSSSYDPPITTAGYTNFKIADSEICMNEAKTFEHSGPVIEA